jgi:hypothetical protein
MKKKHFQFKGVPNTIIRKCKYEFNNHWWVPEIKTRGSMNVNAMAYNTVFIILE